MFENKKMKAIDKNNYLTSKNKKKKVEAIR